MISLASDVKRHALKPPKLAYKWLEYSGQMTNRAVPEAFKRTNLFFKWVESPKKIQKYFHLKGQGLEKTIRATKNTAGICALFGATFKVLKQEGVLKLSSWQVSLFGGVGFAGCLTGIFVNLFEIRDICKKSFGVVAILTLVSKVSSLALNILGAFAFVYGCQIKLLALSICTVSLLVKNYKFYYKELISD